jgi:5'-methylthioadenosine phosphorylase
LVNAVVQAGERVKQLVKYGVTYACVSGPRLGTQAESNFLRQAGCDVVGMTNVPEAFLAREAQIAYATLGMVTDYDCWLEDPALHVSALGIFELYGKTLAKGLQVVQALLESEIPEPEPNIRTALALAALTPDSALTPEQQAWMSVLRR